ncbi:MAG: hypothetical protein ACR2P4_07385, partial [Gammaproteobacteria bacterium]
DAQLRIAAPGYRALKAAVDYYHFDGKGDTKAQSGFRYGMEVQPNADLRFGLYYDSESEKFGGDIAFNFVIGEEQKRESNAAFSPDMFAAVSREYSQRIATVAAVGVSLQISIVGIMTTAITIPAITTTTRMTAAAITTMADVETNMVVPSRMASVQFTVRVDAGANYVVATTRAKVLVTLPPVATPRPHVLTIMRNLAAVFTGISNPTRIIEANNPLLRGIVYGFGDFNSVSPWTITIVDGSEDIVGEPTTTTLTTRTTTTMAGAITETTMMMAAMTTTIRTTTFATTFITLTANSAMGDMGDSRFRGNDERGGSYEMAALDSRFHGNDEKGGNDKQPSFPRKRESKPLSFVHLRDSANGDLSPQMANRRVRKAHS